MLESFIEAGRQDVVNKDELIYGKSITDPCMDWAQSGDAGDPGHAVQSRRAGQRRDHEAGWPD